jgi:hypothetical protein
MSYMFSLVLSREITGDALELLLEGHSGATSRPDKLPTNAEVPVTRIDFNDTVSPSLREAIESALEAVKRVPDLAVSSLNVPAQPAKLADEEMGSES